MSNTTVREEYTPTMDEVRQGYVYGAAQLPAYYSKEHSVALQVHGEQFDRAIAAHDKALRERFEREMLSDDALGRGYVRLIATRRGEHPVATFSAAVQKVVSNAAQIARGEGE